MKTGIDRILYKCGEPRYCEFSNNVGTLDCTKRLDGYCTDRKAKAITIQSIAESLEHEIQIPLITAKSEHDAKMKALECIDNYFGKDTR
jgi:hypothetical protein